MFLKIIGFAYLTKVTTLSPNIDNLGCSNRNLWNARIEGLNEIFRILKPNKTAILFETHKEYDKSDLENIIKCNLSNKGLLARRLVPRFLKKQLRMTFEISELNDLLKESLFGKSFSIEKITLANLPILLKIVLRKD